MQKFLLLMFLLLMVLYVQVSLSKNFDARSRWRKAQDARKLKKDYKRLKKLDGAVKLIGSERGDFEGNVEILHNGVWGAICDDEWDHLEAQVVCRQLGYKGALKSTTNSHFGQAKRRFWMSNVYCNGDEAELSKCRFDRWGHTRDCKSSEAAGVICMRDETLDASATSIAAAGKGLKRRIRHEQREGMSLRLTGGRLRGSQGRVEIKLGGTGDWGLICGDSWSLSEAAVVCRQLGLGFASEALQSNVFGGYEGQTLLSGVQCRGNEMSLMDCLQDRFIECPGTTRSVAGVTCTPEQADLVLDHLELMRTARLEDRPMFWLKCAMEENCVASRAYELHRDTHNWYLQPRRLLRFTVRVLNAGTADFRPYVPKHLWEWHMCHRHYHSMEVFATFDIIDSQGARVAEGHKASFCLEDTQCLRGVEPRYKCANYGDQGISVNCSDIYKHNIDCQWVDISELEPGEYVLKVAVNPQLKVPEMTFENNAALCRLRYTDTYATVYNCKVTRP